MHDGPFAGSLPIKLTDAKLPPPHPQKRDRIITSRKNASLVARLIHQRFLPFA